MVLATHHVTVFQSTAGPYDRNGTGRFLPPGDVTAALACQCKTSLRREAVLVPTSLLARRTEARHTEPRGARILDSK